MRVPVITTLGYRRITSDDQVDIYLLIIYMKMSRLFYIYVAIFNNFVTLRVEASMF